MTTESELPPLQEEVGFEHPEAGQEIDPLAVMTADLQRLQAEYANYRKRVERDRAVASEIAIASVLSELLPLLDGLDRAAEHEELTGGFKAIADQLTSITSRIGLEKFGEAGTEFDPQIHQESKSWQREIYTKRIFIRSWAYQKMRQLMKSKRSTVL